MPSERWIRYKARWNVLTYYQRFESAVALVLTAVIALIILVALYRLCVGVVAGLGEGGGGAVGLAGRWRDDGDAAVDVAGSAGCFLE